MPDGVLAPLAELEVRDLIVPLVAALAAAVRARAEAGLVLDLHLDLEQELRVLLGGLLVRHAPVDEEERERARARIEAGRLCRLEVPDDAHPRRARNAHSLAQGRRVERHIEGPLDLREAPPDALLLSVASLEQLGRVGREAHRDEHAVGPARREQHAEPHRGGEAMPLLGRRLRRCRLLGLVLGAREVVLGGRIARLTIPLGREEPGQVPARRRERQHLVGRARVIGRIERPDQIRLERAHQRVAHVLGRRSSHRPHRRSANMPD